MKTPLFKPQTEWIPPTDFPDLRKYDEIAIDLETKDPNTGKVTTEEYIIKDVNKRNGEIVLRQIRVL